MSENYGEDEVVAFIMERDGVSMAEAKEEFKYLTELFIEALDAGEDPEEWIYENLGLEPDYLEAFWGYV